MNLLRGFCRLFGSGPINVSKPLFWILIMDSTKMGEDILEISNKFYDDISGVSWYGHGEVFQPNIS